MWTAIEVAGAAIGLVLGGIITSALTWRWIFILNIVVTFIAIVGAIAFVPGPRGKRESRRFDSAGAIWRKSSPQAKNREDRSRVSPSAQLGGTRRPPA